MSDPAKLPIFTEAPPHSKISRRTPRIDDPSIVDIHYESRHKELNTIEDSIEQSINTSMATFAHDILQSLRPITAKEINNLTLKIVTNHQTGEPERIVKTWITDKQYFGR